MEAGGWKGTSFKLRVGYTIWLDPWRFLARLGASDFIVSRSICSTIEIALSFSRIRSKMQVLGLGKGVSLFTMVQ